MIEIYKNYDMILLKCAKNIKGIYTYFFKWLKRVITNSLLQHTTGRAGR